VPARPRLRTALRWGVRLTAGALGVALLAAAGVYGAYERQAHARFDVPDHAFAVPDGDAAAVARGRRLATVRGCAGCHGPGLAGRVELDDPVVGRLAGPNLTRGGRGAHLTDRDWERAVRHGVRRDGSPLFVMPAQEHNMMSDEDLGAIAAYARSLPAAVTTPPPSRAGPVLRAMQVAGQVTLLPAATLDHSRTHPAHVAAEPTARYGAYLATMCAGCHGQGFGGGRIPGSPPDWRPAANLTRAGIGHYTEADFARALRTGRRPDGAAIDSSMPWRLTRDMTDVEVRALYAYLRSLPPRPYGSR
jgi:mono/diheme cytochrome c family protein